MPQILITLKDETVLVHVFSKNDIADITAEAEGPVYEGDDENEELVAAQEALAQRAAVREAQQALIKLIFARIVALPTTELPDRVVLEYKAVLDAILAVKAEIEEKPRAV